MGYEKKVCLLYWKKRFSREHAKNPNANVREFFSAMAES